MIEAESLPSRPLTLSEADELETEDDVDSVIPYILDGCSCGTDKVEHVFVKIDGEYVGFDFDQDGGWCVRSRAPTWDEARTAYKENHDAGATV